MVRPDAGEAVTMLVCVLGALAPIAAVLTAAVAVRRAINAYYEDCRRVRVAKLKAFIARDEHARREWRRLRALATTERELLDAHRWCQALRGE